jgi:hypothetical protein
MKSSLSAAIVAAQIVGLALSSPAFALKKLQPYPGGQHPQGDTELPSEAVGHAGGAGVGTAPQHPETGAPRSSGGSLTSEPKHGG